mgnify:CR=1 FL=1
MTDVFSSEKRAWVMSRIRPSNTKPEIWIRKQLFALGFRYRLHDRRLPGKPDVLFPKYRAALFFNGCFWHGHDCHLFKWPKSRPDFWHEKIGKNRERDTRNLKDLQELGWRVITIWECALRGKTRLEPGAVIVETAQWLTEGGDYLVIEGSTKAKDITS